MTHNPEASADPKEKFSLSESLRLMPARSNVYNLSKPIFEFFSQPDKGAYVGEPSPIRGLSQVL